MQTQGRSDEEGLQQDGQVDGWWSVHWHEEDAHEVIEEEVRSETWRSVAPSVAVVDRRPDFPLAAEAVEQRKKERQMAKTKRGPKRGGGGPKTGLSAGGKS
jgi:hypothetical protein